MAVDPEIKARALHASLAAQTDTDRLDWLLARPCRMPIESHRGYIVQEWIGHTTGRGSTAREAIDDAMKAMKAQESK